MEREDYINLQISNSDWSYGSGWGDQMQDAVINWMEKDINNKQSSILDVGCGQGRGVKSLTDIGYENVQGIDISPQKLERGKLKNLKLHQYDINKINQYFNKQSFDFIYSFHTLQHVYDIKQVIKHIMNIVKYKFYFIIPIRQTLQFIQQFNPSHVSPINDPNEFIDILKSLNLKFNCFQKTRLCNQLWGLITK